MEEKLVPAHILFAKWFIRIRWIALVILVISTYAVSNILEIPIREKPIYQLATVLFVLNIVHALLIRRIKKRSSAKIVRRIKREIHFQIITDLLILTLIIHFSGGVENPLILFYFFHMIIASSIFSTVQSYLYAGYAILLVASLALFECYGIIPHYHLEGFVSQEHYKDTLFVYGAGLIFTCTSVLIVSLSHMIIYRSIKTEETYVKTNIELENKDKLKNEYVLRVTHDIKGHVAAIMSCLDVIRTKITGPLNESQEEFTQRAYNRARLLSGFIENLLNLTKKRLQHDKEFEEFSLRDLINKILPPVQILANDKSIDINVFIDRSVRKIIANPYAIEELYSNLLLNAVKYTHEKGHIELSVRNRLNHIITEISDSGIGIPKEELPKVFDEFYRASNVPKDIRTGSGLGLSIAKQIVDNHKGKIWVNSEVGVWTKFTFILPKNPAIIL